MFFFGDPRYFVRVADTLNCWAVILASIVFFHPSCQICAVHVFLNVQPSSGVRSINLSVVQLLEDILFPETTQANSNVVCRP